MSATGTTSISRQTMENLQAAFNGESNAHARYLAFSKQADKEGYAQVAALFRATARAEQIHLESHAAVIRKFGGTPTAHIETPVVKSTRENLEEAIKGETYERDVMYPEFLKEAREQHNSDAIRTFSYAKSAEAEHASLYAAALKNLENMKAKTTSYYVCTVCGFTTSKLDFNRCPACSHPKEKFEEVG